jgi:hypothetical protein
MLKITFAAACMTAALSIPASAAIYGFGCINGGLGTCVASAPSQLTVDVTASTIGVNNAVSFVFGNQGSVQSNIEQIFFDSTPTLFNYGIFATAESAGVDFGNLVAGGNLPRGNTLTPNFNTDVSITKKGGKENGIDNTVAGTETLQVKIALASGKSFTDVINALNANTLRIGLHLISLDCGTTTSSCVDSDSFVTGPPPVVPEPSSYAALLALGISGVVVARRRRKA